MKEKISFESLMSEQLAYSSLRIPLRIPQGLPVSLKIPIIGVNSAVEDAFITNDGKMDVPAGSKNVAWFALGSRPGNVGSAVIGGHYGIQSGMSFVFYNLDKLKIGDKVYVVNDKGETIAFQVKSIKLFDRNADAKTVFTSNDGLAHLNLITCEGTWNQINGTYPLRRVVFTDLVSAKNKSSPGSRLDKNTAQSSQGFIRPPNSGLQNITPAAVSSPSPAFVTSLRSLYQTPVDGLITSILIICIIYLLFKVMSLLLTSRKK